MLKRITLSLLIQTIIIICCSSSSVFDTGESVESKEDEETASPSSEYQYLNETLTYNMTLMETAAAKSPLPTHLTEIDKILRAGLFHLFITIDILSSIFNSKIQYPRKVHEKHFTSY